MSAALTYVQTMANVHVAPEDEIDEQMGQNCKKCGLAIREGHAYELGGDRWHTHCFNCSKCSRLLGVNSNFLVLGTGALVCSECSYSCKSCGKKIYDLAILTGNDAYCSSCFRCRSCKRQIEDLRYARTSKGLFCMSCHERLISRKKKHDSRRILKPTNSSEGSASTTSSLYDKHLPETPAHSSGSSSTLPIQNADTETETKSKLSRELEHSAEDVDDASSISIPVRSPRRSDRVGSVPVHLDLNSTPVLNQEVQQDAYIQSQSLKHTPEGTPEVPALSSLSPYGNIRSNMQGVMSPGNRKAMVIDDEEDDDENELFNDPYRVSAQESASKDGSVIIGENAFSGLTTEMKGLNIGNISAEPPSTPSRMFSPPSTPDRTDPVTSQSGSTQGHSRKHSGGLGRAFSIRSPKAKQIFNFHRHKRSISGNLEVSSTAEKLEKAANETDTDADPNTTPVFSTAAFSTPPLASYESIPSRSPTTHKRSISDSVQKDYKQAEAQLSSLQAEVSHLIHKKTALMRDLETLETQKANLTTDIAVLLEQQKKLEVDTKVEQNRAKSLNSTTDESTTIDVSEKTSTSSNSSKIAEPIAIVNPDETVHSLENSADRSRQKARFWKRSKNTKGILASSPSYQNALNISIDENEVVETEVPPQSGFLSSMIKSRSNNFLSLRNSENAQKIPAEVAVPGKELYKSTLQDRADYEGRPIPFIVERCIAEVEKRGLKSEGIYRISGASSAIDRLETSFRELDLGDESDLRNLAKAISGDINCVTGTLKRYLGKLAEPVIPYSFYDSFINIGSLEVSEQKEALRNVLQNLPNSNREVLLRLSKHLELISNSGNENRMNVHSLSVVFAPTLARYKEADPSREMIDMGSRSAVTELMFLHYDYLLGE
ncbi:unnamed protein product [Kuraishia capsulata CBS 1993]|uniref:Rho-GAP domain-containing protein n=1 Tax=Kuraishia capsulata CBS 1993 TaxID=1382522 RepID=W6MU02_9ASCO|nr:uncharacterized protein KUCA_T00004772001 [Kuraishia capsulata CBS 1993]CDK28787.1 unnamed protein product [Kuraishia capsulata CBS 1993]